MKPLHLLLLITSLLLAPGAAFLAPSVPSRTRTPAFSPRLKVQSEHQSRLHMNPITSFLTEQLFLPQLSLPPSIGQVQAAGEGAFAAAIAIAIIQGALITHQYATNPNGELIVPPGLTIGEEDASKSKPLEEDEFSLEPAVPLDEQSLTEEICSETDTELECNVKKGWYHVNKFLGLLLPALASSASVLLRYEHLVHLAVILGLAHVYDFFQKLPEIPTTKSLGPAFGEHPHIVVLGDSMSVGIGCVQQFDPDKNSGILRRIEQLEPEEGDGPVFPSILARTLSQHLNKPVSWRSAGVDGGDTTAIREYLLPVIQQEVDSGRAPDLVVVLTGSNDLKQILKNGASVRGFCSNLLQLARDIRAISPKTRIVYPALPTSSLDSNSILNVFPLSFILDSLVGFWDAQKSQAADRSESVYHVDLTVKDVNQWYQEEQAAGEQEPTLLAADGIHPNAKCYAKWATFVGHRLFNMLCKEEPEPQAQRPPNYLGGFPRPAWAT